jgi:hypothetical protein
MVRRQAALRIYQIACAASRSRYLKALRSAFNGQDAAAGESRGR